MKPISLDAGSNSKDSRKQQAYFYLFLSDKNDEFNYPAIIIILLDSIKPDLNIVTVRV